MTDKYAELREAASHPGVQYLAEQLQAAYDKVKEWPENSETGFMDLLTLRNLVPDAIDALAAEKARADAAEAERDHYRDALTEIANAFTAHGYSDAMDAVQALKDTAKEAIDAKR